MPKNSQVIDVDNTPSNCHFCSVISKANGEEPIGTAPTCDYWLIVELPQPWSEGVWLENPQLRPIMALIRELIAKQGIKLKPIAIAPDREYSQPGYTRVLYYFRPTELFAEYEKQEYIVPDALMGQLVTELLKRLQQEPNELDSFQQYQQQTSHIREMLVCTHGNVDVACSRFGYPIYKKLRSQYANVSNGKLRVWRCSHFGGHQFAPTLIDLPEGRYWGHLEAKMLELLVLRNSDVSGLRQYYRGWAGLNFFEQIAEREIWMQEGWDWLKYRKAGRALAVKESLETKVLLKFATLDNESSLETYEAMVKLKGEVTSALQSGKAMELKTVKQYQVTCLIKGQFEGN